MPTESFVLAAFTRRAGFFKDAAFWALFFVIATVAFSNSLFQISSSLFIVLSILAIAGTRQVSFLKNGWGILIAIYFVMNLVSLTQSEYLLTSLRGVFAVLRRILLCLAVVYVVDSEKKFRQLFQFFLCVASLIALDALIQGVLGHDLIRWRSMTPYYVGKASRLTGPFHHANDFSAYLSLVFFLFLGILPKGLKLFSPKKYWSYVVGFLAVLISLVGTYSRGAWSAVGISAALFACYKRNLWLIVGFILVLAWGFFFSPDLIRARVWSIGATQNNSTVEERRELWGESFRMIRQSPYFGLGVNTYSRNEPFYKSGGKVIDNQYAHNGYFQMAAEIGCLGLLSFLAVIGYSLASSFYSFACSDNLFAKTAGVCVAFGVFSFLIHSTVETNLQSVLLVNLLWLTIGLMWAVKRLIDRA